MKKRSVLTAIRGFMSASAMPLSSVTPWKVDRSHLYPREKQGDILAEAPTKRRNGGLSRVRVIQSCETIPSLPPRPHASLFFCRNRNIHPSRSRIIGTFEIWTMKSCETLRPLDSHVVVPRLVS